MKSRILMCFTAITLFAALALPLRLAAQEQQNKKLPHYSVTVLGALGGTFSQAVGINNRGWEDGSSRLAGDQAAHAVLWRAGVMTDLGTLGGPNSSSPSGASLNDKGMVLGYSDISTPDPNGLDFCGFGTGLICLPFVWHKGVMTALPLLGGNNGQAWGINNRGEIVGVSEIPTFDPCAPGALQVEAAIWQDGTVKELPPFPGDQDGFAFAINDKEQAVGVTFCFLTGTFRAVLWHKGTVTDLGNLGGAGGNIASDINNRGQVVGQSDLPGDTTHHAFLWENGEMTDLGTLSGVPASAASGINNQGQVVGFSDDLNGNNVALLWQNGVLADLNTLVPPNSPFLFGALGINDRGQIAGYALLSNGEVHGYLLTPCDEHHGDSEGCEEGGEENTLSQTSPAPHAASSRALPPSLMRHMGWHGFPGFPGPAFGPRN